MKVVQARQFTYHGIRVDARLVRDWDGMDMVSVKLEPMDKSEPATIVYFDLQGNVIRRMADNPSGGLQGLDNRAYQRMFMLAAAVFNLFI